MHCLGMYHYVCWVGWMTNTVYVQLQPFFKLFVDFLYCVLYYRSTMPHVQPSTSTGSRCAPPPPAPVATPPSPCVTRPAAADRLDSTCELDTTTRSRVTLILSDGESSDPDLYVSQKKRKKLSLSGSRGKRTLWTSSPASSFGGTPVVNSSTHRWVYWMFMHIFNAAFVCMTSAHS